MKSVTIYHNPRCSKSRETLKLIEQQGISPNIILYLKNPPSVTALQELLAQLDLSARDLMRTKEEIYSTLALANVEQEQQLLEAMVANPKLIERPIVVSEGKAILGRPPENVLSIL
ncbi:arsenate reductase (glutaredoxin) [Corallincola holothuriorum]|uniref:Arsenate reductase n=1 Tax=Corallincola holothuriorum TaxID=2282215 RepID=A0A368NL25_9GAMM|nr:arsenate reductase (glutaredoxin) [Corallincola holothuriorum]RCU50334.1 arsenate reductase (glutaredoxin) [Corallincola holothuriorum]